MSIEVYATDIGTYLNKNGKFDNLDFKSGDYMVLVKLDDVSAMKGGNAALLQQVQGKCWPTVQKSLPGLVAAMKKADAKEEAKRDKARDKAWMEFQDDISTDLIGLCQSVFKDFAKDRKDYRVYKVKKGVGIAISGTSLAGSIALTAASGWTGVGTVVGAIGIVRSSASLAQQIANLAADTEKVYDRLIANILKMRKQMASPGFKANTAAQIANTVMNKVFAVEIESLLVTVGGIEEDFELLLNKVRGNKVNSVSLAGDIPKLMKKQDEVADAIAELRKLGVLTKKEDSKISKLLNEQKDLEQRLDRLLKEISKMGEWINKIESWTVNYHREVATLNSKFSGKAVKVAGVATDLVIAAGSFVAGDFNSPADTIKDLHDASKRLVTALSIANDGYGTVKDMGTSIYKAIKEG